MKQKKEYGEYIKFLRERKKRCIPGFFSNLQRDPEVYLPEG